MRINPIQGIPLMDKAANEHSQKPKDLLNISGPSLISNLSGIH